MIEITQKLIQSLINVQFPQWSHLPIYPVEINGHDNKTFHLWTDMSIRLPYDSCYVSQVEKELLWLPKFKQILSLPISSPLAKGAPTTEYPYPWSINRWIKGDAASKKNIVNQKQFAIDLAIFLKELQAIDVCDGPIAGKHNFYRGGNLSIYQVETQVALENLRTTLPTKVLNEIWSISLQSTWNKNAVWVHGDIALGNLLVKNGTLCGVIDFGILGIGDPSCDYAIAWTFFDQQSKEIFFKELCCDHDTWNRARGWALWKALISYEDKAQKEASYNTIKNILDEYNQKQKK